MRLWDREALSVMRDAYCPSTQLRTDPSTPCGRSGQAGQVFYLALGVSKGSRRSFNFWLSLETEKFSLTNCDPL